MLKLELPPLGENKPVDRGEFLINALSVYGVICLQVHLMCFCSPPPPPPTHIVAFINEVIESLSEMMQVIKITLP